MRGFFSMFGKKPKQYDFREPILVKKCEPSFVAPQGVGVVQKCHPIASGDGQSKIHYAGMCEINFGEGSHAGGGQSKGVPATPYMAIPVKTKLLPNMKKAPEYATVGSAGADLFAALDRPFTLFPGCKARIPTGVAIEIPHGYEAQIRSKSGLADKHGVAVLNSPGTIDQDYRGEISVILINHNHSEKFIIYPGSKIAQLVLAPVFQAKFIASESLAETDRGSGGFGSTGV